MNDTMEISTTRRKIVPLDSYAIRRDFPIFQQPGNRDLVYFDNSATTQRPQVVIDALTEFYREYNANAHRGAYRIAERATTHFEAARQKVADFINASSFREIVFLRSATEAINVVAYSWADRVVGERDEILVSELEHHSNLIPWQMLAKRKRAVLKFIPFDEEGRLDVKRFQNLLSSRTKFVALTHVSNVMGTRTPLREMIESAHAAGAKVIVDGSQGVPHLRVDVQDIGADFYAFSGHKMLAPMGIGVLYGRRMLLEDMEPIMFGGEMISDVDYYHSSWSEIPWKFEAGTQNVAGAIGLGAAVDYIEKIGINKIRANDDLLTDYALSRIKHVDGLKIFGPLSERGPIISFELEGIHAHDLATYLDSRNIAVRAGHHCAKLVMKRLNVSATARISFYLYNTMDEIDRFIEAIEEAKRFFSRWR
jgi:cysteine desulfurase/selenocysteine lyase